MGLVGTWRGKTGGGEFGFPQEFARFFVKGSEYSINGEYFFQRFLDIFYLRGVNRSQFFHKSVLR
jgi:hypothetical protein